MALAKLFYGYVSKTTTSKAFQTDGVYGIYLLVPVRSQTNWNPCANNSTINDMSHDGRERSTITDVDDNQVKKHLK